MQYASQRFKNNSITHHPSIMISLISTTVALYLLPMMNNLSIRNVCTLLLLVVNTLQNHVGATTTSTQSSSTAASFISTSKKTTKLRCATSTAVKQKNSQKSLSIPCLSDSNQMNDVQVISWPNPNSEEGKEDIIFQTKKEFQSEVITYLYSNLMPFDVLNAESLGFPPVANITNYIDGNNDDNALFSLPDGLSNGILEPTMNISFYAKETYPWTKQITKKMYFEYVVNFANVNEARTNWRTIFHDLVQPIIQPLISKPNITVKQVVQELNDQIWTLGASYSQSKSIIFKHGQTPLIYDPMSVLLFGYASCTGLSIFFVNILRTVGIPARLAGTAAWNGSVENGNHSWIEVWDCDTGKWYIMETKPASGNHDGVDLYDPCQWWFCNKEKVEGTEFWAARLDKGGAGDVVFPMAWDLENKGVVGEDRTSFMRDICSGC